MTAARFLFALLYAFTAGVTLSGVAATVLEIAAGGRAGFRPPFIGRDRLAASLGTTLAAGPYMLGNEALAAWRAGIIGTLTLIAWGAVAAIWALASGVVVVELALAAMWLFA